MRWAVMMLVLSSCNCDVRGGVLVVVASPKAISPDGQRAKVTASATRGNGNVGSGQVSFSTSAGALTEPSKVMLDSFGSAAVEVWCDAAQDAKCVDRVTVTADWEDASESVVVSLRVVDAGAGGGTAGGAGGGAGGGTGGGGTGPCADGSRDGLDVARHPNVAACSGFWAGWIDESSAASLCGPGWRVCTGASPALSSITTSDATTTVGCFAYDAANDCGVCFPSCRGSLGTTRMGCTVPPNHNDPNNPDLAAIGSTCLTKLMQTSCLPQSATRVDAATNTTGCVYNPGITGVLCCR